jgi:hypothetical protein
MELLSHSAFQHRQTFSVKNNTLTNKPSYTLQDLWEFFNLCYLGRNESLGAKSVLTKEMIEQKKCALLEGIPTISTEQEELFLRLVRAYGLDAVLFGIERFTENHSVYELNRLETFVKEEEVILANKRRVIGQR